VKIAILSDIHEDIESLKIALTIAESRNCDKIVCLGDICGFSIPAFSYFRTRNASECIKLIRSSCNIVLAGNHDLFAIRKTPDENGFFNYSDNWYQLDFETRKRLANNKIWLYEDSELSSLISHDEEKYLNSLKSYSVLNSENCQIMFSHSVFPDLSGSSTFFPENHQDLKEHFAFMKENNCLIGFTGHGHIQGIELCFGKHYQFYTFSTMKLDNCFQWISCPCVARSNRANGFLIFNTISFELEMIDLDKINS